MPTQVPSESDRQAFVRRVEHSKNYDELFELIKKIVEKETAKHRAGLSLVLCDLPNAIGAYHPVGSNMIVLNRSLIEDLRRIVKKEDEINSFVFTVLMHEYLHSLGMISESKVRQEVQRISSHTLGTGHRTVRMATGNWFETYPELSMIRHSAPGGFEVVQKFDSSSMNYIG